MPLPSDAPRRATQQPPLRPLSPQNKVEQGPSAKVWPPTES